MGNVLHLRDRHEQVQMLLPWRANGTLDEGEAALVDAHVEQCEECSADLAANRALRDRYASMPAAVPMRSEHRAAELLMDRRPGILRRPVPLAWALGGQAVAVAAAAVALLVMRPAAPHDEYQLLSADATEPSGNAIVLFAPEMTTSELTEALQAAGAQVVRGPTSSGAFVVRVDQDERADPLGKLRAGEGVLLAEPLDATAEP